MYFYRVLWCLPDCFDPEPRQTSADWCCTTPLESITIISVSLSPRNWERSWYNHWTLVYVNRKRNIFWAGWSVLATPLLMSPILYFWDVCSFIIFNHQNPGSGSALKPMWVPDTVYILHSLIAGTMVAFFSLDLTCHLLKISRVIVDYGICSKSDLSNHSESRSGVGFGSSSVSEP